MAVTAGLAAPAESPRMVALSQFALLASAFTLLVAGVVLVGWIFDLPLLKTVLPGHVAMKANTAVGLALAAFALMATTLGPRIPRLVPRVMSLLVMLLGAATLFEYAVGAGAAFDTLLFDDPDGRREGRPPGRMSQITALSFVLLGWRGLFGTAPRFSVLSQALAMAVLGIALFALSAYGYAMGTGSTEAPVNPISLHTAIVLLVLALGWLACHRASGLVRLLAAESLGGELARRMLLPALLVPVVLSYLAQVLSSRELLSQDVTVTLLAVSSGVTLAIMIWWASALLDRLERQRRTNRQLRDEANTDALTGLGNRRTFDDSLDRTMREQHASDGELSLLLLDLDHFKAYNDTYGHPAGDEALRQMGRLLPLALRPGDIATRYGGEEFAVLLPGADATSALRVAQRIVADIRTALWLHRPVTVSIGVAHLCRGETAEALLARADAALYTAKQTGRDRAHLAEPCIVAT